MMHSILFRTDNGCKHYKMTRDSPHREDIRDYIKEMYEKCRPFFSDSIHFEQEFPLHFRSRWWELYLASTLIENGFQLQKPNSQGPDLCIKNEPTIWVEAISLTHGDKSKPDRVPEISGSGSVPDEKILLRLTSGFKEKAEKFKNYKEKGIVGEKDISIIALDLSQINYLGDISNAFPSISSAAQAFLGIGKPSISVPVITEELRGSSKDKIEDSSKLFCPQRNKISKQNRVPIDTNNFLKKDYSYISGVITNWEDYMNINRFPKGRSLRLLINPYAENTIDMEKWKFIHMIHYGKDGYLCCWKNPEHDKDGSTNYCF